MDIFNRINILENSFFERWIDDYTKYDIKERGKLIKKYFRETFIEDIPDSDLRVAYKLFWPHSKGKFTSLFKINSGNFSSWEMGKRSSLASKTAVIEYLKDMTNGGSSFDFKFNSFNEVLNLDHKQDLVFFVDMDNVSNTFKTFLLIKNKKEPKFHIFGFFAKEHYNNVILKMTKLPYATMIQTNTTKKDAADFSLTSFLFYRLGAKMNKKISLCILTKDHFVDEIQANLKNISNVNLIPNKTYNTDFIISLYVDYYNIAQDIIQNEYLSYIKFLFIRYSSNERISKSLQIYKNKKTHSVYEMITYSFLRYKNKIYQDHDD